MSGGGGHMPFVGSGSSHHPPPPSRASSTAGVDAAALHAQHAQHVHDHAPLRSASTPSSLASSPPSSSSHPTNNTNTTTPASSIDTSLVQSILHVLRDPVPGERYDPGELDAMDREFKNNPQLNRYLFFIITEYPQQREQMGLPPLALTMLQKVAILLKNNIKSSWRSFSPDLCAYVQFELLRCLAIAHEPIREFMCLSIVAIASATRFDGCPDLLHALIGKLESTNVHEVAGALYTLDLVCEDLAHVLDSERLGRPLNTLVPRLIPFMHHPQVNHRQHALSALNSLLYYRSVAINMHMSTFLRALFELCADSSPTIQSRISYSLSLLFRKDADITPLLPLMNDIIRYALTLMTSTDESVALAAAELWPLLADHPNIDRQVLLPFLPALLPILLKGLVYSPATLAQLESRDDTLLPDRPQDVRPNAYKSSQPATAHHASSASSSSASSSSSSAGGGGGASSSSASTASSSNASSSNAVSRTSSTASTASAHSLASSAAPSAHHQFAPSATNVSAALLAGPSASSYSPSASAHGHPNHHHHHQQQQQQQHGGLGGGSYDGFADDDVHDDDDGDDDYDDDDDDDDDDDELTEWNFRRACARSLDNLAVKFGGMVLTILLPNIEVAMNARGADDAQDAEQWPIRESAVLALGAMATGCHDAFLPFVDKILTHLLHLTKDPRPLVRSITTWTISRFVPMLFPPDEDDEEDASTASASASASASAASNTSAHGQPPVHPLIEPVVHSMLTAIIDRSKKVQEAACTAFALFAEQQVQLLEPYMEPIMSTFLRAESMYQIANLRDLFDSIITFAEVCPDQFASSPQAQPLADALARRWDSISQLDRHVFSLSECLAHLLPILPNQFLPHSMTIFVRSYSIVEQVLIMLSMFQDAQARAQQAAGGASEMGALGLAASIADDEPEPDTEHLVCALDVLGAYLSAAQHNAEPLLARHDKFVENMLLCAHNLEPSVRQSAFAVLGEVARYCGAHVRPLSIRLVEVCLRNMNPEFTSVCNNALWAFSEMCTPLGRELLVPHLPSVIVYTSAILDKQYPPNQQYLALMVIATLGRVAHVCPHEFGAAAGALFPVLLMMSSRVADPREREYAYLGTCSMIDAHPSIAMQYFQQLCFFVASWPDERDTNMMTRLGHLLHSFKAALGDQWHAHFSAIDPNYGRRLAQLYNL